MSLWFKSCDPSAGQTLWAWEGYGGIALRLSSTVTLWHYDGSWQSAADPTTLSADTWYHIVCRYCAVTGELSIFVNNAKTTTASVGGVAASSSPSLYVGNEGWGNQSNGQIDEVGIWYRPLSDTEVGDLYNSGSGEFYGTF